MFFLSNWGGGNLVHLNLGDDQAISISKPSGVCQTALSDQMKVCNKQMEIHSLMASRSSPDRSG